MSVPPFSDVKTKYDMSTFSGRLRYWFESLNPMLLLENERTLQKAQMLLDRWKSGDRGGMTDAELWEARRAVEQCVHPTTGDVIPAPYRMSMFLPLNYVLVPVMMAPSTLLSVPRTFAVQLFNQTFNAAVNYANRSSDKQSTTEIAKAYGAAVTVACGGSLAATAMLRRLPPGTTTATLIRGTVPFLAVSGAAVVNLACMRQSEWCAGGKGVRVKDEDGTVRGQSVAAGWDSLTKCSITRIIWNTPCMVLPTLLMLPLSRFAAIRARPYATECALQIVGLSVGVPPALAAFNTVQTMDASALEAEFQGLKRKDGSPVLQYTYYKGL